MVYRSYARGCIGGTRALGATMRRATAPRTKAQSCSASARAARLRPVLGTPSVAGRGAETQRVTLILDDTCWASYMETSDTPVTMANLEAMMAKMMGTLAKTDDVNILSHDLTNKT